MTRTKLLPCLAAASCLLLPGIVHCEEPSEDSAEVRPLHRQLRDAQTNVKQHELELKMAKLDVEEATIELEKLKLHLQAVQKEGAPHEIRHVQLELRQAAIRVDMRRVQVAMVRLHVERAKAELEHLQAHQQAGRAPEHGEQTGERAIALQHLETMRIARQALLDVGREDAAEQLFRAIRAQEVTLEGRRDEQAREMRESAPTLGQRVELLMFAADKLRDAGKAERAQQVATVGERLLKRFRNQRERDRQTERTGRGAEARVAAKQIEVMQTALAALREGERRDAAELLRRAIQAHQVRLRRLTGTEAETVLDREPTRENTAEALFLASRLWHEFGNRKNAAHVEQLAERLVGRIRGPDREQGVPGPETKLRQRKRLEDELAELQAIIQEVTARAEELRQEFEQ